MPGSEMVKGGKVYNPYRPILGLCLGTPWGPDSRPLTVGGTRLSATRFFCDAPTPNREEQGSRLTDTAVA